MSELPHNRPIFKNLGGWLCLDFVNTQNWGTHEPIYERFVTYLDFVRFCRRFELLTEEEAGRLREEALLRPQDAVALFEAGLALRELIHRIFSAIARGQSPLPADLETLNNLLSRVLPHLRLIPREDGFSWGWAKVE